MWKADGTKKCVVTTDTIWKFKNKDRSVVIDNKLNKINYITPGPSKDIDNRVSAEIMQQLQRDFKDVFTGKSCCRSWFSLEQNC